MSTPNYWQRMRRNKMSRRSLLRASARAGVGAAGLALVGCGDDDDDGQAVTQVQQQQQQQQQAMQQQAQEQQAEQQAMQQQAQEQQAEQQAMQQQAQQEQQQAAVAQAQQEEPIERGRAIVTGIGSDNLFGLDPITGTGGDEHQFVWMVYDTLVGVDADLVPDQSRSLAEFWEIPDDLTFVFTIRPDVRFHDGAPLNAEAVKWHIERARDLDISVAAQDTQLIGDVESVDELTSTWHMDEPFAPLLRMLSDRAGMLVSPKKVMETDDFQNREPTGAGAMVFVEEVESDRLVVKANEDYWMENSPLIDGVTMRLGVQGDQKVNGLLAGDLDIIDGPDPSQLSVIEDAGLTLKGRPSNSLRRTWWNMNMEPWNNPHLRRAVNWAVNRPQINDLVSNGIHTPAHFGLIGPALGDHNPDFEGYSFNPDKVREELALAGHPDGFEYEVNTNGSIPTWVEEDQLISAQLSEFGIVRNLVPKPSPDYYREFWDLQTNSHSSGMSMRPDVWQQMGFIINANGFSKHVLPGPDDPLRQRIDAAILAAAAAFDPAERAEAMNELNAAYIDAAWGIEYYYSAYYVGMQPDIEYTPQAIAKFKLGQNNVQILS